MWMISCVRLLEKISARMVNALGGPAKTRCWSRYRSSTVFSVKIDNSEVDDIVSICLTLSSGVLIAVWETEGKRNN
jgi:hypothetical protein